MNIESFREYCLSLGDVTEKIPFGKFSKRYDTVLVFYVRSHMFCLTDIEDFSFIEVIVSPDKLESLESDFTSVARPMNLSLKYWIRIALKGDMPYDEIKKLVKEGYELVKKKYTK